MIANLKMHTLLNFWRLPTVLLACAFVAPALSAEEVSTLDIELNAAQQEGDRCRLVFIATNNTEENIQGVSLETVLFDQSGTFLKLTLFDFQSLPKDKTRVRQFGLAQTQCADLGQILINGSSKCLISDKESEICESRLRFTTKTGITVTG